MNVDDVIDTIVNVYSILEKSCGNSQELFGLMRRLKIIELVD